MKALSIKQPWASMIIQGYKPVENRTWKSNYRGPLLIHAGKKWDQEGADYIISRLFPHLEKAVMESKELRGGIIGSVTMIDCVTAHDSPWFAGPFGFVFTNPKPMDFKPFPGKLSFFEVPNISML